MATSIVRTIPYWGSGAIYLLAAGAGLLIGTSGIQVAAILLALAGGVLFFFRPDIGVLMVVATIPIENAFVFGGATLTKILGMAALLAWAANRMVWSWEWKTLLTSRFVLCSGAFIGFALASVLWAWMPSVAYGGVLNLAQLFALAVMIADVARSREAAGWMVKVLILSGMVGAILTVQQYYSGLRRAGGQISGNPNGTATLLLTLVPFAFYLFRTERRFLWRAVGLIYIGFTMVAIPVTLSRMNMMLLVGVLVLMSVLTIRGQRGRSWIAFLGIVTCIIGLYVAPWDRIAARVDTIIPYMQASFTRNSDVPVTSGRGFHLRVGLAIARDHPVSGVGYLNYGYYFLRDYQFRVAGAEQLYSTPRSPHSSYVGILADLGVVGIALWILLLFGAGLRGALRGYLASRARDDEHARVLSEAVFIAFALHAIPYGFYLPNQHEKIFWLLLAMTFAIEHVGKRSEVSEASSPGRVGSSKVPLAFAEG